MLLRKPSFQRLAALFAVIAATLLAAGCGGADDGATATTSAGDGANAGGFPATVHHKFGTTTVPAAPERIVSVGLTEHDTLLALGHRPIAITEWYGDQPDGIWPWTRAELGDARPTVLQNSDGFEFERIAELRPDLIVGTNSGMRASDYEKLSKLAPTIAAAPGSTPYFSPWDEQVELIAQALGKPKEGRRLVADVERRFADAAAAHPELRGKTVSFNQNAFSDGLLYSYPDGLNTEFLTLLGLSIEPRVTALADRAGEQVGISPERLDVIDSDIVLFATEKSDDIAALERIPTFGRLRSVAEHRVVFTDGTLAGAIYFMTPLSLRHVVDRLPQELARAAAGKAPREMVGG
ncbi:ABC transporter substrate-binding protein [Conexibacter arvalis]|uniref:Iron complex transport system substrate-binding protein n=1 Tax=Conexibacter arvalis TaxID=912552 RepID=A0A840IA73_9ACTN|nr:ABC transporter substrate-binding protein [Conexibacter arvalis]MBB4660820.1 iron complex transport system substrate-binding protein [Conexibacter arvalis]